MSVTFFIPDCENEDLTLNLANGNFKSLIFGLGLNIESEYSDPSIGPSYDSGSIHPNSLLEKLENIIPELAIRNETQIAKNWVSSGLRLDQIERYILKLKEICEEALKTEKIIYWG